MSILSTRLQTKAAPKPLIPAMGVPYQLLNGRLVSITDNPHSYITKGYNINDIIYSIIKLIVDKVKIAPWAIYKVLDEQSLKALHGMQKKVKWSEKDFGRAKDLQFKALELDINPGKWGDLMKYANEYETMSDFVAYSTAYKLLIGNQYAWADLLGGGANKGTPNSIENLPAQSVEIKSTDSFPTKVTAYNVPMWRREFQPEEIMHGKYWNPNWNINGEQLYGTAPLKAALKISNRDNSSLDSSTARFQNNGAEGILHLKNGSGLEGNDMLKQVQNLKQTMVTEWVGEANTGKWGVSGYEVGFIPIGLSSKEMQQIENEKWNLRRFCNVWGVQSQLLNDPDNKTYANQEEAEKALTTRCALPELTSFRDNLNRKRAKDWGGKPGTIADFDMSVFSELQKDTGAMVTWMQVLIDRGWPLNKALELLQLEKIDNPYYDLPRVTSTMGVSIDEHNMNDVDLALQDES